VEITARSANELDRTLTELRQVHDRVIAVPADVTDRAAVVDMVSQTEAQLGPIDFLVNNAGSGGLLDRSGKPIPTTGGVRLKSTCAAHFSARGRCCPA
jgi:NADP-dependent 3-hydroxy acid dehydrogenase YdfG